MAVSADRNVDGILSYMRQYVALRQAKVVEFNPRFGPVINDITWIHLEILRKVLEKAKVFGGEKYRVADILTGGDDARRRVLLSTTGEQNSIMDDIIERSDESGKGVDQSIHDMRSLFRCTDPSLERLVQLIQHWVKWDLPDAADLHAFDEQVRRLTALRNYQLNDEVRARYRQALGKGQDAAVSDSDIFEVELRRLDQIAGRFCGRRNEDEPHEWIISRLNLDEAREAVARQAAAETSPTDVMVQALKETSVPFNYKLRQCDTVGQRLAEEHRAVEEKLSA